MEKVIRNHAVVLVPQWMNLARQSGYLERSDPQRVFRQTLTGKATDRVGLSLVATACGTLALLMTHSRK